MPRPGSNILIVDAENAPALLNQRARAWDIDSRRLFLMFAPSILSLPKGYPARSIDLAEPAQQLHLVKMVAKIRPALCYSPCDETWLQPPSQPTQVSLCAQWLLNFLARAGTPVKPSDLVRVAAEGNYSRNTLYRTRRALADSIVELGTGPRDPNKRWPLATEPSPPPPTP